MREIVGHHNRRHHTAPSGPTTGPERGLGGLGFGGGRCGGVARCAIKTPGLLTASVVWPGAWRGPIGIKPGRIYPRSPPDQPSDLPTTKDCSALIPNLSIIGSSRFYIGSDLHPWVESAAAARGPTSPLRQTRRPHRHHLGVAHLGIGDDPEPSLKIPGIIISLIFIEQRKLVFRATPLQN
jgi:hypothetical protein